MKKNSQKRVPAGGLVILVAILTLCAGTLSAQKSKTKASKIKKEYVVTPPSFDPVIGTAKRPDPAKEIIRVNTKPDKKYKIANLDYGMQIGIEQTKGGRIWCCFSGGGDNSKSYFVLNWSDDGGETWTDTKAVIDPHDSKLPENRRTIQGNMWCDPDGRLWLFYDVAITYFDGRGGTWATVCDNPDDENPTWSEPQYLWYGSALNKPIVLSNGEWALPIALWRRRLIDILLDKGREKKNIYHDTYHELDSLRSANVLISADKGKTWDLHLGVVVPGQTFDENMIIEHKDGSLDMFIRSSKGYIFRTLSYDKGRTWSEPEEWQPHIASRHFIRRLADGRLLLVRHGMTDEKTPKRSHLRAFISDDDGLTWKGGLLLDERAKISYPDGFESPDGYIYITYDRNRKINGEILLARFTIDDVLNGKVTSERGVLKKVIRAPGKLLGNQ
jgi:predicted neuraminidase